VAIEVVIEIAEIETLEIEVVAAMIEMTEEIDGTIDEMTETRDSVSHNSPLKRIFDFILAMARKLDSAKASLRRSSRMPLMNQGLLPSLSELASVLSTPLLTFQRSLLNQF
jgi:hypothetical protein